MYSYGYGYSYAIGYGFVILAFIITMGAQILVKSRYSKYKKVKCKEKISGYEVARKILDANGLNNVDIVEVQGELTDHYDPSRKVVRLSSDIYHGTSVASVAVSAHECGHAIQDKEGYSFLRFRNKIIPIVNLSSKAGYIAITAGIALSMVNLIWIGIAFEITILLFQLVTLPVEFDASNRALKIINNLKIVNEDEHAGAKKMLTSAALTYVAGVVSTLLEILRLVFMFAGRDKK